MANKDVRKLSRSELLEILVQQMDENDALTEEKDALAEENKQLREKNKSLMITLKQITGIVTGNESWKNKGESVEK